MFEEYRKSVWDAVVGQPRAVDQLSRAAVNPVHAYLFVGPAGSTKHEAARAFAALLLVGHDEPDARDARLALAGWGLDVGVAYWLGVGAVATLLLYEHSLIRPGDLRRLDAAFFTVNGVISIVFLCFVLADIVAR